MASSLSKQELEHLAALSRIEIDSKEEAKLIHDLGEILDYFTELQKLDTSDVPPMTGGTDLRNVFRADDGPANTNRGAGTDAFPNSKDGYLKIPAVFE